MIVSAISSTTEPSPFWITSSVIGSISLLNTATSYLGHTTGENEPPRTPRTPRGGEGNHKGHKDHEDGRRHRAFAVLKHRLSGAIDRRSTPSRTAPSISGRPSSPLRPLGPSRLSSFSSRLG